MEKGPKDRLRNHHTGPPSGSKCKAIVKRIRPGGRPEETHMNEHRRDLFCQSRASIRPTSGFKLRGTIPSKRQGVIDGRH